MNQYNTIPDDVLGTKKRDRKKYERDKEKERAYAQTKKYRDYRGSSQYKEKCSESHRLYYLKYKKELNKKTAYLHKIKHRGDINYKIASRIRNTIRVALNGGRKSAGTEELMGCSFGFLMGYIESKFTEGMSWANYGQFGWHIDHVVPISSFNLSIPEQQKKCFGYLNLQPLWWYDNLRKGNKLVA
jgi:hypothetical protein